MPTPVWFTGFEYGRSDVTSLGGGLFSTIEGSSASITIITGAAHTGTYGMRCESDSSASACFTRNLSNPTIAISRFYFNINSFPTSDQIIFFNYTSGSLHYLSLTINQSDNKLYMGIDGALTTPSALTVTTDTWYFVDVKFNVTNNPWTIDWRVDGISQTQSTYSHASDTIINIGAGCKNLVSSIIYFDDFILSTTAGDYPLRSGGTRGLRPDKDVSYNNASGWLQNAAGQAIDGSPEGYIYLDEDPWTNNWNTDYIKQTTIATGSYIEMGFPTPSEASETEINGLIGILGYSAAATLLTNNMKTYVYNGDGVSTLVYDGDSSLTSATYYANAIITPPSVGWTQGEVGECTVRVGYSSDISPAPFWNVFMLEMAFKYNDPLDVMGATQLQTSENLAWVPLLVVQDSIQLQISEKVDLYSHYFLELVNDTNQLQTSDNLTIHYGRGRILTKTGSFNVDNTKAPGELQSVDGVGFQPGLVLFWWGGSYSTIDSISGSNITAGFGAAIDSSNQFVNTITSEDNVAPTNTYGYLSGSTVLMFWASAGNLDGFLSLSTMDFNGFTFLTGETPSNPYRISYLALGGDGLTVKIGNFNTTIGGGPTDHSIEGVGFKPDAVLFIGQNVTSIPSETTGPNFDIGMASGSANQGLINISTRDNQNPSQTYSYGTSQEVVGMFSSTNPYWREAFVSMDDDGFTLNHREALTSRKVVYIALEGGIYKVNNLNTRTDGNDIVVNDLEFSPKAILFASHNLIESTLNTAQAQARMSIGAVDFLNNQTVQAISDEDNLSPTETAYGNYDNEIYAHIEDDGLIGLASVTSLDEYGFKLVMDDVDPSPLWVTYLVIGGGDDNTPRPPTQSAIQAQTAENIILSAHEPGALLTIQDSTQLQIADNIELTINYLYFVYDATQIHISENIGLLQNYILIVQDTIQLQTADNIILDYHSPETLVLEMHDSIHIQTSENTILTYHELILAGYLFGYKRISFGIGKKGVGI